VNTVDGERQELGGPQIIPRPQDWKPGRPAPWAHLAEGKRHFSVATAAERLATVGVADGGGVARETSGREEPGRTSAVLCVLAEHQGQTMVLLTRRSAAMRHHTREIAFPGGRRDDTDQSYLHTALREANEEVNLDPNDVTVIGELNNFVTGGSGSRVHPFVATVPTLPTNLIANPAEVEAIRWEPVQNLLSDAAWREEIWTRNGRSSPITFMEIEGDTVWGATAMMLRWLFTIVLDVEDPVFTR